jgi:polysaccharide biosynthesis/export protein
MSAPEATESDRVRNLLVLVALAPLSGCGIAPAMQMDQEAAVRRGRERTRDEDFKIHPITSELISRMVLETPPAAKMIDPLAEQAATYEYRVAPFDVLMVTVWDHPELTTPTGQFRSP